MRVFSHRQQGSGLVRAIVVALATLAILLVCFSIYQYSQLDSGKTPQAVRPRLPATPAAKPEDLSLEDGAVAGAKIGPAVVGPGRKFKLTLFRPDDDRAWGEIAVESYTPVAGSPDEYLLIEPEFRMRTPDGHAVRTTARRAILEGKQRGGLNTERGRLLGNVVIEYDRLTEKQRKELPPAQRDVVSPSQVVRLETDELQFDVEYSKVAVPGKLHIQASDVILDTQDIEVRFDESRGRVESLRINHGGTLELRGLTEAEGDLIPGANRRQEKPMSFADWFRRMIQAGLAASQPSVAAATPSRRSHRPTGDATDEPAGAKPANPSPAAVSDSEDGTPVFRLEEEAKPKAAPALRYLARFEGQVEARKVLADVTQARLQAHVLEVLRVVSAQDRARVRAAPTSPSTQATQAKGSPRAQLVITWADKLVVESCSPTDSRCGGAVRSRITAQGEPVRLSSASNEATCARLRFEPEGSKVWLEGADQNPVVVRSASEGTMTGVRIASQRQGDTFSVRVRGPGTLVRTVETAFSSDSDPSRDLPTVRFSDRLDVVGRFVRRTTFDFAHGVSTREHRLLDQASFRGSVRMRDHDTQMNADRITLFFSPAPPGKTQAVDRVEGRGHVVMTQGKDRIACGEMDLLLTTDRDGRIVPLRGTARDHVEAAQGARTIRARDALIVDFAMVDRPSSPVEAAKDTHGAMPRDRTSTPTSEGATSLRHRVLRRREVGIHRLRAAGSVKILDPDQPLELSAETLDCMLDKGREIRTAMVRGTAEQPASVELDRFGVTGQTIKLNVPDEWAQVPGPGRMTFLSRKDLDGRVLDKPVPISVTWEQRMKYQGRENRSVFSGNVHAESANAATFDCQQLVVEFEDVARAEEPRRPVQRWWVLSDILERVTSKPQSKTGVLSRKRFAKEPAYLLATGHAVAQTSEFDEATGQLQSRARLSGPKLSVNLRSDVSKMLIEGKGSLLLEDYRKPAPSSGAPPRDAGGLFGVDAQEGPSKTLIQWSQFMSYDFSMNQTWFEGDVRLKYFSGRELARLFGQASQDDRTEPPGRSTFLTCRVLTADFLGHADRRREKRRMGSLSAAQLKQFHASGMVTLQDVTEGLYVECEDLTYEQQRKILLLEGTERRPALIVRQRRGERPHRGSFLRCVYDLKRNTIEAYRPTYQEQ